MLRPTDTCLIERGQTVLFQGDSVTDAGRREDQAEGLGLGYPRLATARFQAQHPELGVRFINRGVSGDRVRDLERRWTEDCVALQPDWVSILIGINDTWRRFDQNDPETAEAFEAGYRRLLTRTAQETKARLILMEPFALPATREMATAWRDDLDPKIQAVRRLAHEFHALYVPLDGLMAAACRRAPYTLWSPDGVHPSAAGAGLIAQAWLDTVGA